MRLARSWRSLVTCARSAGYGRHRAARGLLTVLAAATALAGSAASAPSATGSAARAASDGPASQLTISLGAGAGTAAPGATVHYTITVTNSGGAAVSGATLTDPLSDVLDDASYNNDATATAGTATFTSPDFSWTGDLATGAIATITFSVTVNNPDTGNKTLTSTITSTTTTGSNCAAGSTDPQCTSTVLVSSLTIASTASTANTAPGGTVRYTITVTNSGGAAVSAATLTDDLTDVLDDASYNNDATATAGTATFTSPDFSWTGDLATGASATITFSVTVNNPDTGNKTLTSTIMSAGSNCAAGSTDPQCTTTVVVPVLVPGLTITITADARTTTPGSTVRYTVSVADTGQTAYTGATITDDLTGVLGNASYDTHAATTAGTVSYTSPDLTWTGKLAPGATATITYSVTVNNPDTGDKQMTDTVTSTTAGSSCPPASPAPACTATVTDLIPALAITKTANVSTTMPGSAVEYTITVADTGQTSYTGAAVTDNLTGVLDQAAYDHDATATTGVVSFAGPILTWTGNLAPGATATITYTVTVSYPDNGSGILTSTVTSTAAGSSCPVETSASACAVSVDVISGSLSITTLPSANLGAAALGGSVGHHLGDVQVVDDRGSGASWTISVSSTDFTTGAGTPVGTISASYGTYTIGSVTTAGSATFTHITTVRLSGSPQAVVSATSVRGNTSITWNPSVLVTAPVGAISGSYSGVITYSVT